eukprot:CAMPEP_0174817668 /NCGR_PEP_ID=MMETSP1107-20130205/155_1 /TAXON_ID=36770 /ORGANISM="Paraphysomonas vestita, Strain GFlagA" /LENGTH=179 /DNA_ID=CAMNT_0016028593 /DNA_START=89 /DNA_END=628 /DNA_ORIENTATION=-
MIVYRDIISGDEMLSDAFPLKPVVDENGEVIEGLMYCESRNITKGGGDIDIGCGNSFGGATEDDAGVDDSVQTVNNVIDSFQYTETQVGSATDFKAWIKEYMNAVRQKLRDAGKEREQIQAFMGQAPNIAKFLLKNFKDLQFYLGPAFDPSTMVFSLYAEGATTPNFYFIMGGYVQEKF